MWSGVSPGVHHQALEANIGHIKVALDPVTMGPKEYRELLEREIAKYQRIGREAKIEKL